MTWFYYTLRRNAPVPVPEGAGTARAQPEMGKT